VDATATFPRDRWKALLERLVALGGSPNPITTHARVTDLDEEVCALMDRANVRNLFIGQESGDQRILNAMRKGTRVDQVRPAVEAMRRHGIVATFGFITGFPGEDAASALATREMALHLNAGTCDPPVAILGHWEIFGAQDLSSVSRREFMKGYHHQYGYDFLPMSADRAAEETLVTYLALSRSPDAPVTFFGIDYSLVEELAWVFSERGGGAEAFRWCKALDRALGIFVANEIEGTPIDDGALAAACDVLRSGYARVRARRAAAARTVAWLRHRLVWRLTSEWQVERERGVGPLTRALLAAEMLSATGRPGHALHALRAGEVPAFGGWEARESEKQIEERRLLAGELAREAADLGKRKLPRAAIRPAPRPSAA
jgi:hypothetical protein